MCFPQDSACENPFGAGDHFGLFVENHFCRSFGALYFFLFYPTACPVGATQWALHLPLLWSWQLVL